MIISLVNLARSPRNKKMGKFLIEFLDKENLRGKVTLNVDVTTSLSGALNWTERTKEAEKFWG